MFSIIAKVTAHQGKENELVEALKELTKISRAEVGCITYIPHVVAGNPTEIIIFEQYVDEAALQLHAQSSPFKAVFEVRFAELISKPLEVTVLNEF